MCAKPAICCARAVLARAGLSTRGDRSANSARSSRCLSSAPCSSAQSFHNAARRPAFRRGVFGDSRVGYIHMDRVRQMTTDGQGTVGVAPPRDEFSAKVDHTIAEAQRALLLLQHPEGYWQAALEANAEMNAEYIIFNRFMELEPDPALDAKLKKILIETQQGDGSWNLFPGGEGHL